MRIRNRTHLINFLLGITLLLSSCGQDKQTEQLASQIDIPINSTFLIDRGDQSVEQIVRQIELQPNREYSDFIDLGTAYLWSGEYLKASEAYEMACREASNQNELTGALMNKAISLGYAEEMKEALNAINLAAKLQPNNLDIVWLRLALYRFYGDPLGIAVSIDHLIALDPSQSGNAIFEPNIIIAMVVILIIVSTTEVINVVLTPPENRAEVILKIWPAYARTSEILGTTLIASKSGELGMYLIDQYNLR